MIDVMVSYPNSDTLSFDDRYYIEKHSPLVDSLLGEHGLRYLRVHRTLNPQSPYYLITHLGFESQQRFEAAFDAVGDQLLGDIPNFTNVEPVLQVNEIVDITA